MEEEISYYEGPRPCENCRRAYVSQIYIDNRTNRLNRVCDRCFIIAWRSKIVLTEVIDDPEQIILGQRIDVVA